MIFCFYRNIQLRANAFRFEIGNVFVQSYVRAEVRQFEVTTRVITLLFQLPNKMGNRWLIRNWKKKNRKIRNCGSRFVVESIKVRKMNYTLTKLAES